MTKQFLAYLFLTALLITGCKSTEETSAQADPDNPDQTVSNEDDFYFQRKFFDAQAQKNLGNLDKAEALFKECLENRKEAVVYYELARIEKENNDLSEALKNAETAHRKKPENYWYADLLASIYKETGDFEKSEELYRIQLENNPSRLETYFELATVQLNQDKVEEAIETYDKLEKEIGVSEELSLQKKKLYDSIGQTEEGIKEIERLSANYPGEMRYLALLHDVYAEAGKNEKAGKILEKMERIDPENGIVQMKLSQYYAANGQDEKSFDALKKAFHTHDIEIDQKVGVLLKFYSISEFDPTAMERALELLEILENTHPKEPKAYAIHGDFLSKNGNLKGATEKYERALTLDQGRKAIWEQLMAIDSQLRNFEKLAEHSDQALALFPNDARFYLNNGIAHVNLGNLDEAISILQAGRSFVIGDDKLKSQFYSTLGEAYHKKENYTASDEAFETALELDPTNVFTMNNYSYYLSVREDNLERAAELALKANTLRPEQPSFQDTYAWVLFKQGNFQEARDWLERAIENGGINQGVILEHYGDVLFELGEIDAAVEQWKSAQNLGGGTDLLDKKIQDKKLYE
ncbi:tetratricopeptide repeat protein [Halocola ammonii]